MMSRAIKGGLNARISNRPRARGLFEYGENWLYSADLVNQNGYMKNDDQDKLVLNNRKVETNLTEVLILLRNRRISNA